MVLDLTAAPGGSVPDEGVSGRDLAPERRRRIRRVLEARRSVRLEQLSAVLGVSQATVRRDLDELEALGVARRVHGGAVLVDDRSVEPGFAAKAGEASAQKERIAARAVERIGPEETVYLDSGSTVLAAARLLRGWERLTVVTNSLPVAVELAGHGPRLIVIGGEVRPTSLAIVGPLTSRLLDAMTVDRALMGTYALSLEDGLTTTDPSEAYTKELVLDRAREVILLADSRKIGARSLVSAGGIGAIDVLVTDSGIDERTARALERRGLTVIQA